MLAPQKVPLKTRLWFYLTCWRPVTKYELSRTIQAFLVVDTKIRMTIEQLNKLTMMFNQMISYQEGLNAGHQTPVVTVPPPSESKKEKKDDDNPMYN